MQQVTRPPFILFSGKSAPVSYNPLEGAVPGSVFAITKKGIYGCAHVLPVARQSFHSPFASCKLRPVVLLVDSAEAHIDFHTFEFAKKNNISL